MLLKNEFCRNVCFVTILLCLCSIKVKSQDSSKAPNKIFYRITLGGGLGKGYPQAASEIGIGGTLRLSIQTEKSLYTIGTTALGEFNIFNFSNINNNISSMELMYGKALSTNAFYCSINGGLSFIKSEESGALVSREGGWLFGFSTYEKIKRTAVGVPLSLQTFWVPARFYGLGIDIYANINSISSFYCISFCHQFGKLRPALKARKQSNKSKLISPSPTL